MEILAIPGDIANWVRRDVEAAEPKDRAQDSECILALVCVLPLPRVAAGARYKKRTARPSVTLLSYRAVRDPRPRTGMRLNDRGDGLP